MRQNNFVYSSAVFHKMKWLRRKPIVDEVVLLREENRALLVQLHDAEDLAKRMEREARVQRAKAEESVATMNVMSDNLVRSSKKVP